MKAYLSVLILSLSGICFLADRPAYGSFLKANNEQIEPYLKKLQENIIEEEKAIEALKKKYESILIRKQKSKEQKDRKEESKKPDTAQSDTTAAQVKLKDPEPTRYSLEQKNQELLNSLEQSIASIQKKNKTIEELKKAKSSVPVKEITSRKASREDDYSKEEASAKKQLNRLQKEKAALEDRLKALKEERENLPARNILQPSPAEKVDIKQEKEARGNIISKESIDSEKLGHNRVSCLNVNQKNNPGALEGFIEKAKKLDSWWRKRVW